MSNLPLIGPWLWGLGCIGIVIALLSRRVRRTTPLIASAVCMLGPLMMCLSMWGLIRLEWTDVLVYRYAPAALVTKPPNIEREWITQGVMSRSDFATFARSAFAIGYVDRLAFLTNSLLDGSLPDPYIRPLFDVTLEVLSDPNSAVTGIEGVVPALLECPKLAQSDRDALVEPMIRLRQHLKNNVGRYVGEAESWTKPLMQRLLTRRLTESHKSAFLASIATPRVQLIPPSAQLLPGQVFAVEVQTLTRIGDDSRGWQWSASLKVDPGACEHLSDGPQLEWGGRTQTLWFRAPRGPAIPPSTTVSISGRAFFRRDRLVDYFDRMQFPDDFKLHEADDIDVTETTAIPLQLRDFSGTPATQQRVSDIGPTAMFLTGTNQGHGRTTPKGMNIVFDVKVRNPPASMAFVATYVDGPRTYPMGRVVAIEGQDAFWSLAVSDVLDSDDESSILLTPCPDLLADTPAATRVYDGPPITLNGLRVMRRSDF